MSSSKQYLIIDTWNGEGYSDSKVHRTLTDNPQELCKKLAKDFCNGNEGHFTNTDNPLRIEYTIGEDDGAVELVELTPDIIGVVLHPNVNEYQIFTDFEEWVDAIDTIRNESGDYVDEDDLFETVHHDIINGWDWILFEIKSKGDVIVDSIKELLSAVEDNTIDLWVDTLEFTVETVVLGEVKEVPQDKDDVVEVNDYSGIKNALDKLEKLVASYEKSK